MSSKGRPYRTFQIDGQEVLVGRGAQENDYLTFRVAEKGDYWLHVGGGTAGSHVVVRCPDGARPPRAVLEKAARLAAWYSKARRASRVDVHACPVSHVSKARGAPRGEVQISRFERLRVEPSLLDEEEPE